MSARSHGLTKTPEFRSWQHLRARCYTPTDAKFASYGARGITVCDRWRESFENFLADMGPKPSPRHSIDRKDNDGPYSPDNCRWATNYEQSLNKRNNRRLTLHGETLTLSEWEQRTGISQDTIGARLRSGWSADRALTTPVDTGKRHRQ
jgi:hypothetical protein